MTSKTFGNIGGLWLGESKTGGQMLTGEIAIDGYLLGVVIFPNTRKKPGSKQPDFVVYARDAERERIEDQLHSQQVIPF